MDYNKTINLPKTDFPMRAGLPKREPEMLKRWEDMDLYNELLKKNEGKPRFSLHDGPPFSNGSLHMGHALNKSLKDIIVRSYAMRGRYTPYIPGWDNHGMPIESAIIKEQKLNRKAMSVSDFRTACHAYAEKYIGIQMEGFKRLGVVADWEHPYKTMNPSFEAEEVKVFGEMYKKGYIYKGLKPVYWCYHDETALAEAEIEYQDDPCTTVYVKFPMHDDQGKLSHLDKSKLNFVIWTTTIWTLPGNLAIALHPSESYAVVKNNGNGEMYIMAEALTDKVMGVAGISDYEIVETHEGAFFENMLADHPFLPKTSRLVLADYVTMDSGTGCVHTAPGFGADDYQTCKRYGMDMVVPVDDQGRHTDYAGKYAGMVVEESNPVILKDMKESGALLASEEIVHSYPHCWRCKHPIIFRATPQWFCSVDAFKDEACAACDEVRWVPGWGIDRMKSMIRERADWCISRQRLWGVPILALLCEDCGEAWNDPEWMRDIAARFAKHPTGCDYWYEADMKDIVPEGLKCPKCGGQHWKRESDILDVWFDSGTSFAAVLEKRPELGFPADLYLEGSDQHRGWFHSSLLASIGTRGVPPYKAVLTHGYVVDGEGRKMSKSIGNGIELDEIISKHGAEIIRMWVSSVDYREDVRISAEIVNRLVDAYRRIRNTCRYLLGNLKDVTKADLVDVKDMDPLDRYALDVAARTHQRVQDAYRDYEFHKVFHSLHNLCSTDLSAFYLDILKDRLYSSAPASRARRSAQTALYHILLMLVQDMAPVLSFTAEEVFRHIPEALHPGAKSVFAFQLMDADAFLLDDADRKRWEAVLAARTEVTRAIEPLRKAGTVGHALDTAVTLYASPELLEVLGGIGTDLRAVCIVSQLHLAPLADAPAGLAQADIAECGKLAVSVAKAVGEKCERCWIYSDELGSDPEHPTLCPRCAAVMKELA